MLKFSEIFEISKEKFRKIPILKEFEWFEWFLMVRSLADRTFQPRRRPQRLRRRVAHERRGGGELPPRLLDGDVADAAGLLAG